MQIKGELTGYVPSMYDEPTYNGEPQNNWTIKVLVTEDTEELVSQLETEYDKGCEWWQGINGRKSFYDPPYKLFDDGSVRVTMTAKLSYEEFPLPVVDCELEPIAKDLWLRPGTKVIAHGEVKFHARKAPKGGIRICPTGVQIIEAVTTSGRDRGPVKFVKQAGFTQSKPNVEKLATVSVEGADPDF